MEITETWKPIERIPLGVGIKKERQGWIYKQDAIIFVPINSVCG